MNYVVLLTLGAIFACVDIASAVDTSCVNISVVNVLGLGACLGDHGDLCTSNSEEAVAFVEKLVECVLTGVGTINVGSQLYVITQLLVLVVDRNQLEIVTDLLRGACGLLGLGTGCEALDLDASVLCEGNIVLNLPSALEIGECLGDQLQPCEQGQLSTGTIVDLLLNVIKCLLEKLSGASLEAVVKNIYCSLLNILNKLLPIGILISILGEGC